MEKKLDVNGEVEEGEFFDAHSYSSSMYRGEKTLRDGTYETGNFKDGKLHGPGKRIYPDGHELEGRFENGVFMQCNPAKH